MSSLLLYTFLAAGLGCIYRIPQAVTHAAVGLQLGLGVTTLFIGLYFCSVVLSMSLGASALVLAIVAGAGICIRIFRGYRNDTNPPIIYVISHPAVILLLGAFLVALYHDGIAYLPVGGDEFSHWLANPIRIYAHEKWAAVYRDLHHYGYLPGWPLIIALPWPWLGGINPGQSVTVLVVLHISVLALVYDIAVSVILRIGDVAEPLARALAWGFLLLFLAAEAMGPLWGRSFLIESPQIYSLVFCLLLFLLAERNESARTYLYGFAGMALAAAYIIKSAALLLLPGAGLMILVAAFRDGEDRTVRFFTAAKNAILICGPTLLIAASWSARVRPTGCDYALLENLTLASISHAMTLDIGGLATRYGSAVGAYVVSYKMPVTLAALAGFVVAAARGRWHVPLVFGTMVVLYFLALYWLHLTCFSDFYLQELNSIPRFTRVILQVFHALGLVFLLHVIAEQLAHHRSGSATIWTRFKLLTNRAPVVIMTVPLVLLFAWQMFGLHKSVADMETRKFYGVDPRIAEVRDAASFIDRHRDLLPDHPRLLILAQGQDDSVVGTGQFYALSRTQGVTAPRFDILREVSWTAVATGAPNFWMTRADKAHMAKTFGRADIIWPVNITPALRVFVAGFIGDAECAARLERIAVLRRINREGQSRYRCIAKSR